MSIGLKGNRLTTIMIVTGCELSKETAPGDIQHSGETLYATFIEGPSSFCTDERQNSHTVEQVTLLKLTRNQN